MRVMVTGSSGHLGEGLVRALRDRGDDVVGLDLLPSPFTTHVGSLSDADLVQECVQGVDVVIHTATLHKPHVATHSRAAFVETNIAGTLNVLEASLAARVSAVVFSSTTSTFGNAMRPPAGAAAVWVTEDLPCQPRNIYGTTKRAAEDLCELFARTKGLPCVVLRVARFFPEDDDSKTARDEFDQQNLKVNELLHRRLDLADAVEAHVLAAKRAGELGFGRYILSATTPFDPEHLAGLGADAPSLVRELVPAVEDVYPERGWKLPTSMGRVYVNERAREDLGWQPTVDFAHAVQSLAAGNEPFSALSREVGSKGYHLQVFEEGPYPVEP